MYCIVLYYIILYYIFHIGIVMSHKDKDPYEPIQDFM